MAYSTILGMLIAGAESNYGAASSAQPPSMLYPEFGQYSGFVNQYGGGEAGITNYAQQVLAANPNATLGDLYGGYFGGTGNPAAASTSLFSNWGSAGSAAQQNWNNVLAANGYSASTPLSSVIGNSATSSNDPLGSSVTIAGEYDTTSGLPYDEGTAYTGDTSNLIADLGGSTGASSTAVGNNQGTPNLGGGITSPSLGTTGTGTPLPGQQNTGEASIAGQSVQKGLGTAGTDVQTAAGGIAGTIASTINSIEQYTTSAFVIAVLVVIGAIFVAYGLGLFGKRTLAEVGI